ncbi:MAG: NAD-dependent epimerase [Gemmatimonadetes bacterium]|nr:NAD-dependent epimerase [Gemmatimonadota bacterium]
MSTPILVTGAAGFIGYHTAERLLVRGNQVVGLDNLNPYYDPALKEARLARLQARSGFSFRRVELADREAVEAVFEGDRPEVVIHLAAQAGVRYSLTNPHAYAHSNLTGFLHILEGCRRHQVRHLVYASTSSVYGANTGMPFSERHGVNHPLTLYAATKRANELMAHSYSHLYGIPMSGLRFFTVYGPWGRPDMALFLFTKAILEGRPIDVFNEGRMRRDFTYVDDLVEGVIRVADRPPKGDPAWDGNAPDPSRSAAPWRIYNIGNSQPTDLFRYIEVLEECLGRKAERRLLPMQPGDVPATWADVSLLDEAVGYRPATTIEEGVAKFVAWYREYYGVPEWIPPGDAGQGFEY